MKTDGGGAARPGRIPVAVLGATGGVGQRFVSLLQHHPWFEVACLTASDRSAGRHYGDSVEWVQTSPIPSGAASIVVGRSVPPLPVRIVFSALDASVAGAIESEFAREGHVVISNARNHRLDPDVPLVVPEVNPEHLELLSRQGGGKGALVTNPNCSTIGLALALKPLVDAFGVDRVHVVTLQAVSGAGRAAARTLDIADNVIPFIAGEEEKIERETLKIFGSVQEQGIVPAKMAVTAQCTRVPVTEGHTECVSIRLGRAASREEVRAAWEEFSALPQTLDLPSAPRRPVHFLEEEAFPQPRIHRDAEGGMSISVGRLRPVLDRADPADPADRATRAEPASPTDAADRADGADRATRADAADRTDRATRAGATDRTDASGPVRGSRDYHFVAVSHNTVRGAAGGAILCAELLLARGGIEGLEKSSALPDETAATSVSSPRNPGDSR